MNDTTTCLTTSSSTGVLSRARLWRHQRLIVLGVALSFGVQQAAIAISVRDDVDLNEYASLALSPEFAAAGYLSEVGFGQVCTGTLVAPDKVLTAAHCVDTDEFTPGVEVNSADLMFGVEPNVPRRFRNNVTSITVHPNWADNVVTFEGDATFDLAVLTLSAPILDVTPARITAENPQGRLGTLLGYGLQGTGGNFPDDLPIVPDRLAAQNIIDFVGVNLDVSDNPIIEADFDNPALNTNTYGDATPVGLEGTTASGDSGGPLFAHFAGGAFVTGVLNSGFNFFGDDSAYGDISTWAPVGTAANLQFLASQGILPVPEPSTAFLAIASAVLTASRRRAR